MGITQYRLAKEIGVSQRRIGLQADYDRETTKDAMVKTLARIKPWPKADSLARRPVTRGRTAPDAAGGVRN